MKTRKRGQKRKPPANKVNDEFLISDDEIEPIDIPPKDEILESAEERRIRLSRLRLDQLQADIKSTELEDADVHLQMHDKLSNEVLIAQGKLRVNLSQHLNSNLQGSNAQLDNVSYNINAPPTSINFLTNNKLIVTSKSNKISIVDINNTNIDIINTNIKGMFLDSITLYNNNNNLFAACSNNNIYIFDIRIDNNKANTSIISTLKGHQKPVTSVSLLSTSDMYSSNNSEYTLVSASYDRSIRLWDIRNCSFLEPLYGPKGGITYCNSIPNSNANSYNLYNNYSYNGAEGLVLSCNTDNSIYLHNISKATYSIYYAKELETVESVCMINSHNFLYGSNSGNIGFLIRSKRKPVSVIKAHNTNDNNSSFQGVSSVFAIPNSDLCFSGGRNSLNIYSITKGGNSDSDSHTRSDSKLSLLHSISNINGLVNCMNSDGKVLAFGTGTENRLGRWEVFNNAENKISVCKLI